MPHSLPANLDNLDAQTLRQMLAASWQREARAQQALEEQALDHARIVETKARVIRDKDFRIAKLSHELAVLRNFRFGRKSEQYTDRQTLLFEEDFESDLANVEQELEQALNENPEPNQSKKKKPARRRLPSDLPRVKIHHEPEHTHCQCGCELQRVGEDVTEKLDYIPGTAQVEQHIRGKWACRSCDTLTQEPMPAHVIDKGLASTGLLAHILIAKYADHLPLYRQQQIFGREGIDLSVSTMADWVGRCGAQLLPLVEALQALVLNSAILHADETPLKVLCSHKGGKIRKAYLWAYSPAEREPLKAVIYDLAVSRSGAHAREFLGEWKGKLVVDNYSGYKQSFRDRGVVELGCMAHARRKFHDLYVANKSEIAQHALTVFQKLYEIEEEARDLSASERLRLRQSESEPILEKFHAWMLAQRNLVLEGSGIAQALDYSLKRWAALIRYLSDGNAPIDNNHIERQFRPVALGRKNWLFAGSMRAGKRAAAIMSLIQSAKLNGLNPHAYLKDVLERLPTHPNNRIEELLPHRWQPTTP